MTTSVLAEQYTAPTTPDIAIQNAAEAQGIALEPTRLAHLTRMAERIQYYDGMPEADKPRMEFTDTTTGLDVWRSTYSERFGGTAAKVDFTPILEGEGDLVSGTATAKPENATIYTRMLIHGMQNYVLLVNAGVVSKPDVVYGNTNPQMAIVAERFGMFSDIARQHPGKPAVAHDLMRKTPKMDVYGSFDEVSQNAFSESTKRLEQLMTRRLAAQQRVGETALRT
jgi:hypothetical protein